MPDGSNDGSNSTVPFSFLKQRFFELLPAFKSSHLTEAIANGLGYKTYAAFSIDLEAGPARLFPIQRFDRDAMAIRLAELSKQDAASVRAAVETLFSEVRLRCLGAFGWGPEIAVGPNSLFVTDEPRIKAEALTIVMPVLQACLDHGRPRIVVHHSSGSALMRIETTQAAFEEIEIYIDTLAFAEAVKILTDGRYPQAAQFSFHYEGEDYPVRVQMLDGNLSGVGESKDVGMMIIIRPPKSVIERMISRRNLPDMADKPYHGAAICRS